MFFFFFFFQAEDGIRDGRVTGVQTCALPISALAQPRRLVQIWSSRRGWASAASMRRSASSQLAGSGASETSSLRRTPASSRSITSANAPSGERESGVEGKRGGIGGRRVHEKK